jgi:hypothetical protein
LGCGNRSIQNLPQSIRFVDTAAQKRSLDISMENISAMLTD